MIKFATNEQFAANPSPIFIWGTGPEQKQVNQQNWIG